MKVSKKIRFGHSDADRTEEFGDFEAIVCNMTRSLSAERWHLHRKVGTLSAKRWLLGRAEATRRAQRRRYQNTEGEDRGLRRIQDTSGSRSVCMLSFHCRDCKEKWSIKVWNALPTDDSGQSGQVALSKLSLLRRYAWCPLRSHGDMTE